MPKGEKVNIAQEQPPMGPHHEKKTKRLIYPTLTFSALTTRLKITNNVFLKDLNNSYLNTLINRRRDHFVNSWYRGQ